MKTILSNANLVDCVEPKVRPDTTVLIEDGRIRAILPNGEVGSLGDAQVIDLKGGYLMPGLWDVHIHPDYLSLDEMPLAAQVTLFGHRLAAALTESGIVGMRCAGAHHFMDVAWKRAFDSGQHVGPRLFASGHFLTTTGGHFLTSGHALEVDGPYGWVKAIREQIKNGVDHIKLNLSGGIMGPAWDLHTHSFLLDEEIRAAFEICRTRGFKVMAHATNPDAVKNAIRLGAHSVEHGYIMDDECIALLIEHDTWYVPTLAISHLTASQATSPFEAAWVTERGLSHALCCRAEAASDVHATWFRKALDAGVRMAVGSDIRPLKEAALLEMGLWVRDGATPWQTLVAATRHGAEVCGVGADLGTVEVGKLADLPMGAQIWAPLSFSAETAANRRSLYITALGRLASGRTLEDAKAQMAIVGDRLSRDYPDTNRGREIRVYTLGDGMIDIGLTPILSMWQASACFVLLIACANVASLLLARGAERQREMAVRLAIGASRTRVVRELLIESLLLALAAVPAALAVTWFSLKLIVAYMPAKIARFVAGWYQMDVDLRLIAYTAVLAIGTALVFGLIPAIQASRPRLTETLKEGGRSSTAGATRLRMRRGLVVAEMALALPLLVAASLSVLTVHRFLNGPQGFNPDGLLTMRLQLPNARYPAGDDYRRFAGAIVERLRAVTGVDAAAAINVMPAADNNSGQSVEIEGIPNPDPTNPPEVDYRTATPELFAALQIPIRAGRAFTDADREDSQQVTIVTESLARKHWPGTDPIGKRIRTGTGPWLTVVGVAGDVIHDWFGRRNYPTLYRPFRQAPTSNIALAIRTSRDPSTLVADARAALRAVDPSQAMFDVRSMRQALQERTIGLQYVGAVMLVFGGLALLLAVIGVYGVMANLVTQRTHEIGVRMALGATRRDVLRLTVGQTGRLTIVGVGLGVGLSLLLGRLIEAGLLGVTSSDARVTGGLAAVLIASALLAGYLPARRAASIDPTVALRGE